ncbi:bifunctional apoptosis regulator-like [Mercenaria mercenaria]|uniref:bifunctional apoptosis regulator-like n=1 Tax=Mercenaria mercenaria TaxID=6596 RepID=UPI00234E7DB3|nr:bifunctional apoptosis regulator-like [Mercenaria mercenaria]
MTDTGGSEERNRNNSESSLSERDNEERLQRSLSASDDFLCGCCFDLMVQPTTLTCGHSFCRLCVANWYFSSKKMECPQCRSAWTGNPQINITLRNLLSKMHADSIQEREAEILTSKAKETIAKFDAALSENNVSESNKAQGQGFCGGLCLALAIIVVVYLSWYWRSSDQDLLVHKPLVKWTVDDVDQWFTDMGLWTQEYVKIVRERNIGGSLMLQLDETNIDSIFNISDPLHKRALINSVNVIKDRGVKPPSNLWEFKSLNPGWALFLLYGMKDFPRSTLLYLYFVEYETMFLPFAHVVCPISEDVPKYDFTHSPPPLTSVQWAEFMPKYLFLPYFLIAEFSWDWMDIHYWTSRFILANCLVLTLLEANYVAMYIRGENEFRSISVLVKSTLKNYLSIGIFVMIWPLVPSFVCDCFFYVALYFSPYQVSEKIYTLWRR